MQENDDINTAYLKMIIDWMKMTRQFSLAAASLHALPCTYIRQSRGAAEMIRVRG